MGIALVLPHEKSRWGSRAHLDALLKVEASSLDSKTKKSIASKMKNVVEEVKSVEEASGIRYPTYYVEPVLTVVPATGNIADGLGVLYARTIPVEFEGKVRIVVEISAPLVLFATKATMKLVLAHEFLHYVELVKNFVSMDIVSQITASTIFEERFADSSRAVDPARVFSNKKLVRDLGKKTSAGLDDPKLNEKCNAKWISKGMPMRRIAMGRNQVSISVQAIAQSKFDPRVTELVNKIRGV